jgi:hypothetical protein
LYVFSGGAGEASSAGYGREAVKMPVFMPWPQSGRMQYEKIKKNKFKKSIQPGIRPRLLAANKRGAP